MTCDSGRKLIAGLLGLILFWVLSSCAQMRELGERVLPPGGPKAEEVKPRKGIAYYEHRVKWTGENLSIISKWYTGSPENWMILANINPGIDPNRIQIGEKVRIPQDLMKTRKPMPETFPASFGPKKKEKTPPTPPEPKPPEVKETPIEPRREIKKRLPARPAYYEHTVKWSGETLSLIAKWYTGRLDNWRALAKTNPKINPSQIYIGQKIRIPEDLLKTREAMPKVFLAGGGKKKEKAPPQPKSPPPAQEEEPQLFGPKPYSQK